MSGRYYRIRQANAVNNFSYLDYGARCAEIEWANVDNANKKHVVVKHSKGKMATVATLVNDILPRNGAKKAESYGKYASLNTKTVFRFGTKEDAAKARDVINSMVDDSIQESKIRTNGSVVTQNGLNAVVDVKLNPDGTVSADNTQNYVSAGSESIAQTVASSGNGLWLVIGAAVLVAVVAVAVIVKLKRKKK